MITLTWYRCECCEEVHENSCDIFKCKICGVEICDDCSTDDGECMDYCEPKEINYDSKSNF